MKQINIIFILFVVLLTACSNINTDELVDKINSNENITNLSDQQLQNLKLTFTKIDSMPFSRTIKLTGIIDVPPQNMISVNVPMGGFLKHTKLLPGMHIKKGETLSVIEDQQYIQLQQDFLITKSKFQLAELEFLRQKELNVNKASSDKVFQTAQAEYQQLSVLLKSYSEKLKMIGINPALLSDQNISSTIKIVSPIDGYVTKVNVNIGKYILPSEIIFELVDPKDIHLNLTVFENEINNLYIGQKLKAFNNSNPDLAHLCHIILIGKDFSSQNSVSVHCHFDDYDQTLLPGMYMNAELQTKSILRTVLPSESILVFEGRNYVFCKNDTQYEFVEIEIGNTNQSFTQIINPEKLIGRTIVAKGAYDLLMSLKNTDEE
ncbi:MAG: efflux RND transporter periplasmic adaptor subunit [Bacteroidota bacterium]|nr:efflux RND transporter periplasmic adaptor subunit [Bacteroidota bacterium]